MIHTVRARRRTILSIAVISGLQYLRKRGTMKALQISVNREENKIIIIIAPSIYRYRPLRMDVRPGLSELE